MAIIHNSDLDKAVKTLAAFYSAPVSEKQAEQMNLTYWWEWQNSYDYGGCKLWRVCLLTGERTAAAGFDFKAYKLNKEQFLKAINFKIEALTALKS